MYQYFLGCKKSESWITTYMDICIKKCKLEKKYRWGKRQDLFNHFIDLKFYQYILQISQVWLFNGSTCCNKMGPNYFLPQYSCCLVGQPCIIRWTMWWSVSYMSRWFSNFWKKEWHKNSHGGAYISIASVS